MEALKEILSKLKGNELQDLRSSTQAKTQGILNATSDCPYGECDGKGLSVVRNADGSTRAVPCRCMAEIITRQRLRLSGIPEEFRETKVNDFLTDIYTGKDRVLAESAKRLAIGYINKFEAVKKTGKGLFLYSETKGSGKTMLGAGICNALIKKHKQRVRFMTTVSLLNKIKASFDSPELSTDSLIYEMTAIDILMLDDIGAEKPTEWVNNIFYSIINDRMSAKKITIFTSNTNAEALKLDERIISRIGKMSIPVKMPEESIRDIKSRTENEEILKMIMG